jgi:twitching motility protein PilJ
MNASDASSRWRLRATAAVLVVLAIVGALGALFMHWDAERDARVRTANEALASLSILVRAADDAAQGKEAAFHDLRGSSAVLVGVLKSLKDGTGDVPKAPSSVMVQINALLPVVGRIERNAQTLLNQQGALVEVASALRAIHELTPGLLETGQGLALDLERAHAPAAEVAAAGQLVTLIQSINKSAGELVEGINPEAAFQLGKDLNSFHEVAEGLRKGSAATNPQVRQGLEELLTAFQKTRTRGSRVMANLIGLVSVRYAHEAIVADSLATRRALGALAQALAATRF